MEGQNPRPGTPGSSTAGAANTPSFDRDREGRAQSTGNESKTETQRELERTRDVVAETAAPVVAQKVQEAVSETTDRLTSGPMADRMKEQVKNTASAMQHDAAQAAKDRVSEGANQAMDRAAGTIENAARKLDEIADRQTAGATGTRAKAGRMAHGTADTMESVAHYLRENDVKQLQSDLERQVRESPVQTLLIGVAAGWLVGKILR